MSYVSVSSALKKGKGSVSLRGWAYRVRASKNVIFIILRDGTGIVQCVVKKDSPFFEDAGKLTIESSLELTGIIKKDARATTGFEVEVTSLKIHQISAAFPVNREKQTVEHLMDIRHLWIRSTELRAVLKIRHHYFKTMRAWLDSIDYIETTGPMIVGTKGEDGGELFELDFFGQKGYLSQTNQMHLEAQIFSFERVFSIVPSFRAEKSRTRKHLTEYWHLEIEEAWADLDVLAKRAEGLIVAGAQGIAKNCKEELKILGVDPKRLLDVKAPFKKITYSKAIELLQKKGSKIKWGDDIKTEDERLLTSSEKQPMFITHWPRSIKAFYMKVNDKDSRVVDCFDLQAPGGFGEIIGGSVREVDPKIIEENLVKEGDDPKRYEWYLDLRKYGSIPHAGFGLGTERVLTWLLNLEHIRDSTPFPRFMNRLKP